MPRCARTAADGQAQALPLIVLMKGPERNTGGLILKSGAQGWGWAEAHSPVADTVSRAVPGKFKVEII